MLHILFTTTVVSMIAYYMKMNKEQYILAMLIVVPLMIAHKLYLGEM
tara:strand:- start:1380 stop:1520 length:141 start_codon:yes stop_codon:yes gene_type:complete